MGTHPVNVQGKWEHKETQPKEKTKANNHRKSGKDPYLVKIFWTLSHDVIMEPPHAA